MAAFLTPEGFKKTSIESSTGPVGQAKAFAETIYTADATITFNGKKTNIDQYAVFLDEVRGKVTESDCTVHDFVLDGNKLAVRVTGISKTSGHESAFESFIFAEIDKEAGKLTSSNIRSVTGPVGGELK